MKENSEFIVDIIDKANKRKPIRDEFNRGMLEIIGKELYTPISGGANVSKILKAIYASSINIYDIEHFFHIISQKRTTNKLYYYSTPKEVNDLLVMLLDLQDNDEVYNPCYGIGSIFLSIGNINPSINLYGEELDDRLSNIAKLIARFSNIQSYNLYVNDILKQAIFKSGKKLRKFDKIICNPPIYVHMGIEQLKGDERFNKVGIIAKNYPELVFLTHALSHLNARGVFIVRNQILQKSFLEGKLHEKLVKERMIEAIIELPKNIFPLQSHDFSVLVLSHNNKNILHINANNAQFYEKDGKYNKLINIDKIVDIFTNKKETQYSKTTDIESVKTHDLRASHYLSTSCNNTDSLLLRDINVTIFRGQRVYGGGNDCVIDYYDVGIADFSTCGFTSKFDNKKISGNKQKIHKYRLKPYDILFSLRGIIPKMTILDKNTKDIVAIANAGILILRLDNKDKAIGLYCHFFSNTGFKQLKDICESSGDNMLYVNKLLDITIPRDYIEVGLRKMPKLESLKHKFEDLETKLEVLKRD